MDAICVWFFYPAKFAPREPNVLIVNDVELLKLQLNQNGSYKTIHDVSYSILGYRTKIQGL